MSGFCSLRPSNPLRSVAELFDAVWRFTLAIAGRDPVSLLENDLEAEYTDVPQKIPYNLRPRVMVNYKE